MKIALVGCGYIGKKRLLSLDADDIVVGVSDVDAARAREVAAGRTGARVFRDWEEAVACAEVETIIISTTNDWLAPITRAAVLSGKNVLVEKPGARSREEIRDVIDAARTRNVTVQVGFNHRYHPALMKAKEIVASGELGPLMFVRARYGHGGRVGYDREWRADPRISGGGELLDQGSHLIDLARWFLGDFPARRGIRGDDVLEHAGGGQCVPHAAHGGQPDRVAARELFGMEESLFLRGLRPRRKARDRRSWRELRHRAARLLQDAAADGTPADNDLGIPGCRYLLGNRVSQVQNGDQGEIASRCQSGGRGGGAGGDTRGLR